MSYAKKLTVLFISSFLFWIVFCHPAYSTGFEMTEAGEIVKDDSVAIPESNMEAGTFVYVINNKEYKITRKAGVLVNGRVMYYVDSKENATVPLSKQGEWYGGEFDPGGETHFGIYKDYLVMDSWAFGASHNRKLFLFRLGKNTVELLDVLVNAFPERFEDLVWDFMTAYARKYPENYEGPFWTDIGDLDGDGYPEVKISILRMEYEGNIDYDERIFDIYLEIRNEKLHVDLNPVLYKPLFIKEKARYARRRKKSDAYYVYGFLSGELSLDKIRELLKGKVQYKSVVPVLEQRANWDLAFRRETTEEGLIPVLVREELKKK